MLAFARVQQVYARLIVRPQPNHPESAKSLGRLSV